MGKWKTMKEIIEKDVKRCQNFMDLEEDSEYSDNYIIWEDRKDILEKVLNVMNCLEEQKHSCVLHHSDSNEEPKQRNCDNCTFFKERGCKFPFEQV